MQRIIKSVHISKYYRAKGLIYVIEKLNVKFRKKLIFSLNDYEYLILFLH